jgi:hypothetical protein
MSSTLININLELIGYRILVSHNPPFPSPTSLPLFGHFLQLVVSYCKE